MAALVAAKNRQAPRFAGAVWRAPSMVQLFLGGESPPHAVETGSASLGKGVHREVESEESWWRNKVVTNRKWI